MDLRLLETLKQKLAKSKDLAEPFEYFIDHFGTDLQFMQMGQSFQAPVLEEFIAGIAQHWFKTNLIRLDQQLVQIPKTSFVHGICRINGRQSNVIYFDDIKVGLVALLPTRPGEKMEYGRFTGRKAPPPEAFASEN